MTRASKNSPRGDKWQKRAKAFNRFEPDRGKTRPSEWYIMWYTLLYLFERSIRVEDTKREDEDDEDGLTESDSETSSEEEDFDEASESLAGSSRKKAWASWVRERFRKSEATSASASNEESSQDKSWVSWLRELFRKAKNDREKRGPSTV